MNTGHGISQVIGNFYLFIYLLNLSFWILSGPFSKNNNCFRPGRLFMLVINSPGNQQYSENQTELANLIKK